MTENKEGFKVSRVWFDNFKRSGICSVVKHGKGVNSNVKAANAFTAEFHKLMFSEYYCHNKF